MHQTYLSPLTSTCSGGCGLRWQWQPVPFPLEGFVPPCLLLAAPPPRLGAATGAAGLRRAAGVSPFVCWLSPAVPSSRCWLYMAPCYPEQHLPAAVSGPNPPPAIRSHRTRPPGSPRAPGAAHPGGQRGGGGLRCRCSSRGGPGPRAPGSALPLGLNRGADGSARARAAVVLKRTARLPAGPAPRRSCPGARGGPPPASARFRSRPGAPRRSPKGKGRANRGWSHTAGVSSRGWTRSSGRDWRSRLTLCFFLWHFVLHESFWFEKLLLRSSCLQFSLGPTKLYKCPKISQVFYISR